MHTKLRNAWPRPGLPRPSMLDRAWRSFAERLLVDTHTKNVPVAAFLRMIRNS